MGKPSRADTGLEAEPCLRRRNAVALLAGRSLPGGSSGQENKEDK